MRLAAAGRLQVLATLFSGFEKDDPAYAQNTMVGPGFFLD